MKVQAARADAFIASAWGKVRAVLLFGPDAGLARERAMTLIAAADTVKFPFALAEIMGASFKDAPSRLHDELAAVPFGGGRRVVHVRDLSDWRMADRCAEAVAAALGSWPGDALLVVEAGELKPRAALRRAFEEADTAAAIGCYADDAEAVRRLIAAVAREHKLRVSTEAEDFLVERLGADRLATRGELEKLALYAGGEGRIELADAQAAIGDGGASELDDVVDASASGDLPGLDRALSRCLAAGLSPISVLRALARHLERLLSVRAAMDTGANAQQAMAMLRPPPFYNRAVLFERQVRAFERDDLAGLLGGISDAEIACKSSGAMPDEAILGRVCIGIAVKGRGKRRQ